MINVAETKCISTEDQHEELYDIILWPRTNPRNVYNPFDVDGWALHFGIGFKWDCDIDIAILYKYTFERMKLLDGVIS